MRSRLFRELLRTAHLQWGVYRLQTRQITYDDRGLPLAVQLVGVPIHHVGRDVPLEGPNLIGRLDEFVSMETGKQIHGSELLDLL